MPDKRQKVITALNKFMWLKRRAMEEALPEERLRRLARAYWGKGDRKLLEELLPTYEHAKKILLEMHSLITEGSAEFFYDYACPFCTRWIVAPDCGQCPYKREKGKCGQDGAVWTRLRRALPKKVRHSTALTQKLWEQSGCEALAWKLFREV